MENKAEVSWHQVEIRAKNYATLEEAMGAKEYTAYKGNLGLEAAPAAVQKQLKEIAPAGASHRYAEVKTGDETKKRLFVEQKLKSGIGLVFAIDLDKSKPHVYKLDSLFICDQGGQTINLLEEVDETTETYFLPVAYHAYDPKSKLMFLGDLVKSAEEINPNIGPEVYLHEIGHEKDAKSRKEETMANVEEDRKKDGLLKLVNFVESMGIKVRQSSNEAVRKLFKSLEDFGFKYLEAERLATDYARMYMVRKRDSNFDLCPNRPGSLFADSLDMAYATHELYLLGKSTVSYGQDLRLETKEGSIRMMKVLRQVGNLVAEQKRRFGAY